LGGPIRSPFAIAQFAELSHSVAAWLPL